MRRHSDRPTDGGGAIAILRIRLKPDDLPAQRSQGSEQPARTASDIENPGTGGADPGRNDIAQKGDDGRRVRVERVVEMCDVRQRSARLITTRVGHLTPQLSCERINKSEREALAIHRSLVSFSVR